MKRNQNRENFVIEILFAIAIVLAIAVFTVVRILTGIVISDDQQTLSQDLGVTVPCVQEERTIEQFAVGFLTSMPQYFSTDGGELFFQYSGAPASGIFTPSLSSSLYVGPAATPPIVDTSQALSYVTNASDQFGVKSDQYAELSLEAGQYWLLSTNTGTVSIASCGVKD